MKAIINGKRFDTATATLIGDASYPGSQTDFQWWRAGLYKTPRSGQFFLAGQGGPMTRWAQPIGNQGMTGGEGVVPMTLEEARDWAERYLTIAEVEAAFSDHIEDA
jgi:hypothetical protein